MGHETGNGELVLRDVGRHHSVQKRNRKNAKTERDQRRGAWNLTGSQNIHLCELERFNQRRSETCSDGLEWTQTTQV